MDWHGNGHGHGHGHGAQAKAQVQFTAKRLRSFTHIAAQSLTVAVTSALSNDGAVPLEKTPGVSRGRRERSHPTEKQRERR